jgi:hypothetical protein
MQGEANRRHISLGAASLAVGGAAFALVQILQASIGAFSPRPVVTVLIAAFAALVISTLGQMRQSSLRNRRMTWAPDRWSYQLTARRSVR